MFRLIALSLFSVIVLAQPQAHIYVASNPSGACTARAVPQITMSTGAISTCANGTWSVTGTVSPTGTVTNVTGTAPIAVATGTTTPVISLLNTAVTPGAYTNMNATVDSKGRITAAANGSSTGGVSSIIAGIGISVNAATGAVTVTNTSPGASPAGPLYAVQGNDPVGTLYGDANFLYVPTAFADPATPVISHTGTAGVTNYTYRAVAYNSIGWTNASLASTATGNATLDGTNWNNIVVACTGLATGTPIEIFRSASGGTPSSIGRIDDGTFTCGATPFQDKGLPGDGTNTNGVGNSTDGVSVANNFTVGGGLFAFRQGSFDPKEWSLNIGLNSNLLRGSSAGGRSGDFVVSSLASNGQPLNFFLASDNGQAPLLSFVTANGTFSPWAPTDVTNGLRLMTIDADGWLGGQIVTGGDIVGYVDGAPANGILPMSFAIEACCDTVTGNGGAWLNVSQGGDVQIGFNFSSSVGLFDKGSGEMELNNGNPVSTIGSLAKLTLGTINPLLYTTATNCSDSAGAASCGTAAAGRFVVDAAATSVVVSTTAVTANSEIFVEYDSSLSAALSVTCNATIPSAYAVTARTAGASFTLATTANIANPGCFSYHIIN